MKLWIILQCVQQNGEYEEHNGRKEHQSGRDDGEQSQLSFKRTDSVFGEEGIGAAGDGAHIVARSFLHNNDNDHGNTRKYH